jgi:hypothetical protein
MPTATGRSRPVPCFLRWPGARFTVIRRAGKEKPLFWMAERTRSRLSRTAASGSPTTLSAGRPPAVSTSTAIGIASIP